MPSPASSLYPIPRSWEEFEDIVADVFRIRWDDPNIKRFGRSGQQQHGVDIVGNPRYLDRALAGIQCKRVKSLDIGTVLNEADKARLFAPPIGAFTVATTIARDAPLQSAVWGAASSYPFQLDIVFWDDICADIAGHQNLLQKHFPGWAKATTTKARAIKILADAAPTDFEFHDCPPRYIYLPDVDIRLEEDTSTPGEKFHQPWLDCFISRSHYTTRLHLYCRESRVETFYFVNADGGRAYIPYPTIKEPLRISPLQYNLARIINGQHLGCDLDDALQRTHISVDSTLGNWPVRRV